MLSSQVPETEPVYRTKHKNSWGFPFYSFRFCKLTYMPVADDHSWCYWVLLFFSFLFLSSAAPCSHRWIGKQYKIKDCVMSQCNLSLRLLEANTHTYTQILTSSGKLYTDGVMPYSTSQLVIYCGNKLHPP